MASDHAVLNAILIGKEFDAPLVQLSVGIIGKLCGGKQRKDVQKAIRNLEAKGILELRGDRLGGKGRVNEFEIIDATGEIPRYGASKGGGNRTKGGGKSHQRGGKATTHPYNQYNKKGKKETPSRGQDDKSSGGMSHEESSKLADLTRRYGYHMGSDKWREWKKQRGQ